MRSIRVKGKSPLKGVFSLPGDKSISHRAVMLGAIANGLTEVDGFATGEDCANTVKALQSLGVDIKVVGVRFIEPVRTGAINVAPTDGKKENFYGARLIIEGRGLHGLKKADGIIDAGNSGTTIRILLGILAGQPFQTCITGDESLKRRPMRRVTEPLMKMGARISGRDGANFAPLTIEGGVLRPIPHVSPIPSAQVKSAVLLAGLYADGKTQVTEPLLSRDHTERMLKYFGAEIDTPGTQACRGSIDRTRNNGRHKPVPGQSLLLTGSGVHESRPYKNLTVAIKGEQELEGKKFNIPGDISAASFFITAAAIIPDSNIKVSSAGVNPTRTRLIDILQKAGAKIKLSHSKEELFEPVADITVEGSEVNPLEIRPDDIPGVQDEIPVLAVAGAVIGGQTTIRGARELRVKESDRIKSLATNLSRLGADVEELEDGLSIRGGKPLVGCEVDSFGDHRIAMAMVIAGLMADGETIVLNTECIDTSFPEFIDTIKMLAPAVEIRGHNT